MIPRSKSLTRWLENTNPTFFSAYCIAAAFTTYFCMYGFRKPFTAATFEGLEYWNTSYKLILIASQVSGYTISKFLGIKFVSETRGPRRAIAIVLLIAIAQFALLLFAITPRPWNMFMLFLNGLPLGMVFGLVLTFLEGRKLTEALVAGLCISFIVSSGVVKSIGESLILSGVSEFWMPFSAGLIFIVPLLISVWMLSHIPVPTQADVDLRTERVAMDHLARRSFFRRHIFAIVSLLFIYFVLTIIRSIRDDFGVEIWQQLGYGGKPENYTLSELQVGFWVTVICAGSFLIKRNRAAFLWSLVSIIIGFGLMLITVIAYHQHWITGFQFMVLLGLGIYIPYVSFHTTVFERFLAALHEKGTIGYLMYLADAFGYLAYVAIVMINLRLHAGGDEIETAQASTPKLFLELLEGVSFGFAILVIAFTLILMIYFSRKIPKQHTTVTLKQRENG